MCKIAATVLGLKKFIIEIPRMSPSVEGEEDRDAAVQLVKQSSRVIHLNRVLCVPPIVELGEAVSLLHRDVPDPAVALQELLYVPSKKKINRVKNIHCLKVQIFPKLQK